MHRFLLGILFLTMAPGFAIIGASPMDRGFDSNLGKGKQPVNEHDPWLGLNTLSNVHLEGQTTHPRYVDHAPQIADKIHQVHYEDNILDGFEHLEMSQPASNTQPYGWNPPNYQPWQPTQQYQQFEIGDNHGHGMSAGLPWIQEQYQYGGKSDQATGPDHSMTQQQLKSSSNHATFSSPFDERVLGGTSSPFFAQEWEKMDHGSRSGSAGASSSTNRQDNDLLQEIETHLINSPPRDTTPSKHIAALIPPNNVFDGDELSPDLSLHHLSLALRFANDNPPGSLTVAERSSLRKQMRAKGIPLRLKYVKNMPAEDKLARQKIYQERRNAKRLQAKLARVIGAGSSNVEPEKKYESNPPEGFSKEDYRYLYIDPEKMAKLTDSQRYMLIAFYTKYPIGKKLPALRTSERSTFYNDRDSLIRMGIPLSKPGKGRPPLNEAEAEEAKNRNRLKSREYIARKREAMRQALKDPQID